MDPRLYQCVCPGRVLNIQRSNGAGGARWGVGGGGPRGSPGVPASRSCLAGLIHKATVRMVNAERSLVAVEWSEGGAVKGKEVRLCGGFPQKKSKTVPSVSQGAPAVLGLPSGGLMLRPGWRNNPAVLIAGVICK